MARRCLFVLVAVALASATPGFAQEPAPTADSALEGKQLWDAACQRLKAVWESDLAKSKDAGFELDAAPGDLEGCRLEMVDKGPRRATAEALCVVGMDWDRASDGVSYLCRRVGRLTETPAPRPLSTRVWLARQPSAAKLRAMACRRSAALLKTDDELAQRASDPGRWDSLARGLHVEFCTDSAPSGQRAAMAEAWSRCVLRARTATGYSVFGWCSEERNLEGSEYLAAVVHRREVCRWVAERSVLTAAVRQLWKHKTLTWSQCLEARCMRELAQLKSDSEEAARDCLSCLDEFSEAAYAACVREEAPPSRCVRAEGSAGATDDLTVLAWNLEIEDACNRLLERVTVPAAERDNQASFFGNVLRTCLMDLGSVDEGLDKRISCLDKMTSWSQKSYAACRGPGTPQLWGQAVAHESALLAVYSGARRSDDPYFAQPADAVAKLSLERFKRTAGLRADRAARCIQALDKESFGYSAYARMKRCLDLLDPTPP